MLPDQQRLCTGFRCELGVAILQWTALREGGLLLQREEGAKGFSIAAETSR
jgi:hypothetical protein